MRTFHRRSLCKNYRVNPFDGVAIERCSVGVSERKRGFGGVGCFEVFHDFQFGFELLHPLFSAREKKHNFDAQCPHFLLYGEIFFMDG
jgi:hypothetical protein